MELLLLPLWSASGIALAAVLSNEPKQRLAWAPMAAFLGPIWAAVAIEQRPRTEPTPDAGEALTLQ